MGQKVSPIGMRIGINKTWESKWYAGNKDFAKYFFIFLFIIILMETQKIQLLFNFTLPYFPGDLRKP